MLTEDIRFVGLAPGVEFIKLLQADFEGADPKSAKKTFKSSIFFVLLGSAPVKAAHRMNVYEIDTWIQFKN